LNILFAPSARRQFLEAVEYIRRDNPAAVFDFRDKAEKSLSRLPEFPDLPFREVVVPPYRFFYRVKDETVWIVAVWHGAQLPYEPER
jgi:toxin ParE1/3/4